MSGFSRESTPARSTVVTFRVTPEEKVLLQNTAAALGVAGQSEVVRLALDYYYENNPAAQAAASKESPRARRVKGASVGTDAKSER